MRPIDADALVEAIKDYPYGFRGMIVCDIAKQPTIDVPDRKVGKWKHDADGLVWCYGCGFGKERSDERPYNYCPNCGAKMGGDIKDSE